MILLISPSEKVARALARRLELQGGNSPFLGRNDSYAVAAVPTRVSEACGVSGYLLGLLHSSNAGAAEIALAAVAVPPEATAVPLPRGAASPDTRSPDPGAAPILGFSVVGADERSALYVDPLLTGGLIPGSIHSSLLRNLLGWADSLLPTDMLYPLFLADGESNQRSLDLTTSYISRLAEELPESKEPLSSEDEELLLAIADSLRLSHAGTQRLLAAGRDRAIRSGGLPGALHGYADLRCATRQEGERVLASILELLMDGKYG